MQKLIIFILLLHVIPTTNAALLSDKYQCSSLEHHQLEVITSGAIALKSYIAAIERAKESIELESFVFDLDASTELILQALYKKAKAGVPIRVLLDSYGSQKNVLNASEWFKRLQQLGVQIRFYNTAAFEAFPINHRKFLFIDHQFVFSGGRNLSAENFQMNNEKNRIDYSYTLEGPIVFCASESFEKYWNSNLTEKYPAPERFNFRELKFSAAALSIQEKLKHLNPPPQASIFQIAKITFVSDHPTSELRFFADFLADKIIHTTSKLTIETPNFFTDEKIGSSLHRLLRLQKSVTVYTQEASTHYFSKENLLYSMLSTNPHRITDLQDWGAEVHFYNGFYPEANPLINESLKNTEWGSHCKLVIFDEKDVLLSSYNFDVVSELKNREAGFYLEDAKPLADYFLNLQASRQYQ